MVKVTSVRLSDDLATKLDQLATAMERPRSWVIEKAIARYIDDEFCEVMAIREALDDVESGNAVLIPHEQVVAEMEEKIRARTQSASQLA